MSDNLKAFSVYAADILRHLHNSFPLIDTLYSSDFVRYDLDEKLMNELKINMEIGNMVKLVKELSHSEQVRLDELRKKITGLEQQKFNIILLQKSLFEGTKQFLLAEGFIRAPENNDVRFQLAAKGFSALNKDFKDGDFTNGSRSFIQAIQFYLEDTKTITKGILSGVLQAVITQLISTNN